MGGGMLIVGGGGLGWGEEGSGGWRVQHLL